MTPRISIPPAAFPMPESRTALRPIALVALVALVSGGCAHDHALPPRAAAAAIAAHQPLTIDALYDSEKKLDFNGHPPTNLVWLDDSHYLWPKSDPKTKKPDWVKVDAATGQSTPFDGPVQTIAVLSTDPALASDAQKLAYEDPAVFARDSKTQLFTVGSNLYGYTFGSGQVVRFTDNPVNDSAKKTDAGGPEQAALSPDGRSVAFVHRNNLFVSGGTPVVARQITNDGSDEVLNGKLDWLYQEEVYGRGTFRSHWWSPDSRRIAFLRLDEKGVPPYTLVDDSSHVPTVETTPYPRPGEPNPTVKLGIVDERDVSIRWVDLAAYAGSEFLIVDVAWSPSGTLVFQVQDREQTWLDLVAVDPDTGASKTLLRETSRTFVNANGSPTWLADGSFLWFSERTGFKHFYHYAQDGTLIRAVTNGAWEVRTLHGIEPKSGFVYFSGTERSAIDSDAYRVKLDGSSFERLTRRAGTHSVSFSPSYSYFIDTWSDVWTPTQVHLCRGNGEPVRAIDENEVAALAHVALSKPEFVRVKTRDGGEMDALLVRPVDFDPTRRYPVFQHAYAGPHSPQVRNAWLGTNGMFFQLLAQRGVVVWVCDNRTASGKGTQSEQAAYLRLGESELADIEDGVTWLKSQPWVDGTRIGISGWSYGGFITAYALTHSTAFAMGIAGGSVTDWKSYDSIYTERYMKLPANNPDGYARTSVTAAAANLSGKLLLIHGAIDDNVHPQNTMQLVDALQKAGKSFELMLYPRARHGIGNPKQVKHLRQLMLDFIERTLLTDHPTE